MRQVGWHLATLRVKIDFTQYVNKASVHDDAFGCS